MKIMNIKPQSLFSFFYYASLAAFSLGSLGAIALSVPTTINYQGRLTDNTPQQAPVNGVVPMQFEMWDAASGGTRLWREPDADDTGENVTVSGGIFNVLLGQGNPLPATVFAAGGDRYLQVILNPRTVPELLQPRQQVGSTAYAALAQSAGDSNQLGGVAAAQYQQRIAPAPCPPGQYMDALNVNGSPSCRPDQIGVTVVSASQGLSGSITGGTLNLSTDVTVQRRNVAPNCPAGQFLQAVAANGTPSCVLDETGVTSAVSGGGVTGLVAGNVLTLGSDTTIQRRTVAPSCLVGQFVRSLAADGTPSCAADAGAVAPLVLSANSAATVISGTNGGTGYGVSGQATSGYGVAGISQTGIGIYAESLTNNALFGRTFGNDSAVNGWASATTGPNWGVLGQSDSTDGSGMRGVATAATGFTIGASGASSSTSGVGVLGKTTAASGYTYGVTGIADSTTGRGVFGHATAVSGATNGVVGQTESAAGAGVRAIGAGSANTALLVESGGIRVLGAGVGSNTAVFQVNGVSTNVCGVNGNSCVITNNSQINGNPNAFLMVTPFAVDPGSPVYVLYNVGGCTAGRWVICASNQSSMIGTKFFGLAFQAP